MSGTGHRQLEHTADLALELWAPSEEELLAEGARAIVELLTEGAAVAPRASRTVHVDGIDREERLVRFLNEVLLLAVVHEFLVAEVDVALRGASLDAVVRGEAGAAAKMRTELKSVTHHDLALWQDGQSWRARVVIDV